MAVVCRSERLKINKPSLRVSIRNISRPFLQVPLNPSCCGWNASVFITDKKNEIKGKGKLDTASEFCKAHSLDDEQLSKITVFSSSTGVMFWIIKLIRRLFDSFPKGGVFLEKCSLNCNTRYSLRQRRRQFTH